MLIYLSPVVLTSIFSAVKRKKVILANSITGGKGIYKKDFIILQVFLYIYILVFIAIVFMLYKSYLEDTKPKNWVNAIILTLLFSG